MRAVPPGEAGDQDTRATGSPPLVNRIWFLRADASTRAPPERAAPGSPPAGSPRGFSALDTGKSPSRAITRAMASAFVPSGRLYFSRSDSAETAPGVPATGVAEDICPASLVTTRGTVTCVRSPSSAFGSRAKAVKPEISNPGVQLSSSEFQAGA